MAIGQSTLKEPGAKPAASSPPQEASPAPSKSASSSEDGSEIARILGISVPVAVTLAERPMSIESLLAVTVGTILEFDVASDAELTLYAANQPIGKGLAVKVGENFGIRVTKIGTVRERIDAFHQ